MRLFKILRIRHQNKISKEEVTRNETQKKNIFWPAYKAVNDYSITCYEARLNLALGLSPILARLKEEYKRPNNKIDKYQ